MRLAIPLEYVAADDQGQKQGRIGAIDVEVTEIDAKDAPIAARLLNYQRFRKGGIYNCDFRFAEGRLWHRAGGHVGETYRVSDYQRLDRGMGADEWLRECGQLPYHDQPLFAVEDPLKPRSCKHVYGRNRGIHFEIDRPHVPMRDEMLPVAVEAKRLAAAHRIINGEIWAPSVGPLVYLSARAPGGWVSASFRHPGEGTLRAPDNRVRFFRHDEVDLAREIGRKLYRANVQVDGSVEVLIPEALTFDAYESAVEGAAWAAIWALRRYTPKDAPEGVVRAVLDLRAEVSRRWPGYTFDFDVIKGSELCQIPEMQEEFPPHDALMGILTRIRDNLDLSELDILEDLLHVLRERTDARPVLDDDEEALASFGVG